MTPQSLEYQIAAVPGANSVQLVCMLYDTVVRDLTRAIKAIETGDVEARTSEVKHALLVLQQLEAFLDMENGGEAAVNLSRFYALSRAMIMQGQGKIDASLFRKQIELFLDVRSAWEQSNARGPEPSERTPVRATDDSENSNGLQSLSCSV
jgi:flagellar secretion chaperone FliS